jgi:hypothetical protein
MSVRPRCRPDGHTIPEPVTSAWETFGRVGPPHLGAGRDSAKLLRPHRPLYVRDGPGGRPGGPGQLTATALTRRELALFLGASVQARRHRELSAKALTPPLGEGRVRRLQKEAGPALCRRLLVAGAPGAEKGRPLRAVF